LSQGISDPVALEYIAEHVNTVTGAASKFTGSDKADANVNKFIDGMSIPFIAPRLYASVFKAMWEMSPPVLAYRAYKGFTAQNEDLSDVYLRQVKNNVKILATQGAFLAGMYMLTENYGEEDDEKKYFDFFGNTFLKAKLGDNVVSLNPF